MPVSIHVHIRSKVTARCPINGRRFRMNQDKLRKWDHTRALNPYEWKYETEMRILHLSMLTVYYWKGHGRREVTWSTNIYMKINSDYMFKAARTFFTYYHILYWNILTRSFVILEVNSSSFLFRFCHRYIFSSPLAPISIFEIWEIAFFLCSWVWQTCFCSLQAED